jgi:aspartate kinase
MSRPMSRIVVLKFGGATLASPARIRRAARRLGAWRRAGASPAAVVSACGHTTDRILRWLGAVTGEPSSPGRESDRALATGEDLAASLLAAALGARGIPAVGLRGGEAGFQAVGPHGEGRITRVDAAPVRRILDRGRVPIIAGFQAVTPDGETVTLGRGASDLSAVRLAAALGASECHLVKDVAGVHDRDPHLHADAEPFAVLDPADLQRLARAGSGVVHAEAAEEAEALGVTLRIYDFRDPVFGEHGTTVGAPRSATVPSAVGP